MQLSRKVVPHLGNIAVFLTGELDAEAVRLQRGSRGLSGLHSLVADRGRGHLGQGSLLGARAVAATALVVKQHTWGTPHGGTTL